MKNTIRLLFLGGFLMLSAATAGAVLVSAAQPQPKLSACSGGCGRADECPPPCICVQVASSFFCGLPSNNRAVHVIR